MPFVNVFRLLTDEAFTLSQNREWVGQLTRRINLDSGRASANQLKAIMRNSTVQLIVDEL